MLDDDDGLVNHAVNARHAPWASAHSPWTQGGEAGGEAGIAGADGAARRQVAGGGRTGESAAYAGDFFGGVLRALDVTPLRRLALQVVATYRTPTNTTMAAVSRA